MGQKITAKHWVPQDKRKEVQLPRAAELCPLTHTSGKRSKAAHSHGTALRGDREAENGRSENHPGPTSG